MKIILFGTCSTVTFSAQRNETKIKQFQKTVYNCLELFCFSFISLCGQFNVVKLHTLEICAWNYTGWLKKVSHFD